MDSSLSYSQLVKHFKKLARFHHLQAISGWDQAAMMPNGGNEARSEAMAELALLCHELMTEEKLTTWFSNVDENQLSAEETTSFKEMYRVWQQANCLPGELVERQSLIGSQCEHAWRTQRTENDWEGFKANLKEVVELSRQEARIRAEKTGLSPYDALLNMYEPGMTCERLDVIFNDIKSWLPELIQQAQQKQTALAPLTGSFAVEQQKSLSISAMTLLGFDFNHGRLDISTHPFCGGVPSDVRITTRYDETDFTSALMGVIHETGHARYEQGLPKQWRDLPVGEARSMGIHESQSLFFEMQLARSPAFMAHVSPLVKTCFDRDGDKTLSAEALLQRINFVKPDFIRVDADEVTYPAHVILRYEIERDLIEGNIEVDDIPAIWDQKMEEYLGVDSRGNYQKGCMQDIHWTDGSFGYFPSYTLGAMYAAQFMASMRKNVPVDDVIASGDLNPIFTWLHNNIWSKGSTLSTDELVQAATGESLNPIHFKEHLYRRYLSY